MQIKQDTSASRIVVYRLLSDLFAQPATAAKISQLAAVAVQEDLNDDPCIGPLLARFQVFDKDPTLSESDLAGAYAFLFLGAGGSQSVPSSQSSFVDPRGRVCQAPTAAMAQHLKDLNMHVAGTYREPADHIAVILAVAAQLIASGRPTAQQIEFLEDHLAAWLPEFGTACARSDQHGFYALLARTAEDFVAEDLKWLWTRPVRVKEEEENV